jgi:hypothetical protein
MGASSSFTVERSQQDAYNAVFNALENNAAELTNQTPPARLEFTMQRKDIMAKFLGEARINVLQNGKTSINLEVNPDTGSLAIAGIGGVILVLVFAYLLGGLGLLIGICILGALVYIMWQDAPDKMVKRLKDSIMTYDVTRTPAPGYSAAPSSGVVQEKFCSSCGQKIESDAKFCSHCGATQ